MQASYSTEAVTEMMIEEESGTYSGRTHSHNGYSAGDFSGVPFKWTKFYPPYMSMPQYPRN